MKIAGPTGQEKKKSRRERKYERGLRHVLLAWPFLARACAFGWSGRSVFFFLLFFSSLFLLFLS
jgi:hypothetical protein